MSFHGRPGYERLEIEVRGGSSSSSSEWSSGAIPFEADREWIQVRLVAARNPVSLGTAFGSEFVDTWVPNAKPEEQTVTWYLTDPLGRETQLRGSYEGHFRWRVAFYPKVPGRWSYYVDHDPNWPPYPSEQVVFDVISDDLTIVLDHLEELAAGIDASDLTTPRAKFKTFSDELMRLERAGIRLLIPEMFRSERAVQLSARIDEIRRELGRELPEEPSAFERKPRRSIKRDIARKVYRALDIHPDIH